MVAKPSASERAKLRSGLRARLGKPEPAPKRVSPEKRLRDLQAIERDLEDRTFVDDERPSERRKRINRIPEPAERKVSTWRGRKPIIKGGAVIGRRTGGNQA